MDKETKRQEENKFSKRFDYLKNKYKEELEKTFKNNSEEEKFFKVMYGMELFEEKLREGLELSKKEREAEELFKKYPELLPKKKPFHLSAITIIILIAVLLGTSLGIILAFLLYPLFAY